MPASSIRITVPPTSTGLTTLERVRRELGITSDDTDDILQDKIAEASSILRALITSVLGVTTVEETFLYHGGRSFNTNILRLKYFPIVSVTSLNLDGSIWATDLYTINKVNGILALTDTGSSYYPYSFRFDDTLIATYVAGYSLPGEVNFTLPRAIESACVDLVTWLWTAKGRDLSLVSEENVGVARFVYGGSQLVQGIPAGIYAKIEKWTV